MARYLLRAVRQIVVLELTGKEEEIEAQTEAEVNIAARKFLVEQFPSDENLGPAPDIEVEIKRVGDSKPVTARPFPEGMEPKNRAGVTPPAPF